MPRLSLRTPAALLLGLAVLGTSACGLLPGSEPVRDDSGAITEADTDADVFSLTVGDCTTDPEDVGTEAAEVTTVPVVPCAEPHDNEVYASTMLPDGDYPGEDAVLESADTHCYDAFAGFVGTAYEDSVYDYWPMYPTSESWAQGDREVLCLVYHGELEPVTGTLEGIAG
ncbi:septum formation family protein [Cellulosimicrobium sp. PMB13]|uniref:septum formation family protein n=1 Tax=Cellulosimicrobium sp. PMB13 TaxID=3120158 RepID=UPI003F4BE17F